MGTIDNGNESRRSDEDSDDEDSVLLSPGEWEEEGSNSSVDVEDVDSEIGMDISSPARSRTHIENEQWQQCNLFQLLLQLHKEWIRLESMRIDDNDRVCDKCHVHNPPALWWCNECSLLKYSSPRLCEECVVRSHVNNPHCMDVLHREESVFRKPFFHEMITFRLATLVCRSCKSTKPRTITVFIASHNGIFCCNCPDGGSLCYDCGAEFITSPIAFDCLPCEPVHQSGCTWFTNSILSFMQTLQSEGGTSANALARAIMEHWLSRNSFLVGHGRSTNADTFSVPNITIHWLEKKTRSDIDNWYIDGASKLE